uniref:Cytochrome P450 2K1-like n=1 Tax=Anabas testudineus TaxID=64144 RepID=A0A3Q1HUS8_ANATE
MSLFDDSAFVLFSSQTTLLWTCLVLLILCLLSSRFSSQETWKEPPGPWPLPLVGNLLQLDLKKSHKTLCELAKKYGPVFTVHFGTKRVVVLAGYKTVQEALVRYPEEFGDREISPIAHDVSHGHGIMFANGDSWKEMRRFTLSTLRDFGMGKRLAEERIIDECHHLVKEFKEHEGMELKVNFSKLYFATSNIITAIVYGHRYEYSDPRLTDMGRRASDLIRITGSPSIQLYNMFPWLLRWIKNRKLMLNDVESNIRDVKEFTKHLKATLNPDSCRGLVDCFLVRQQKEEDSGVTDTHYNEMNMICTVTNLFSAGTDTTTSSLRWGLLLMAKYPQIQDRVQEELSCVIGRRQVRAEDRKNLPYTDAVIHEVLRVSNIVPLSVPHATSRDVTFQGFFIRKGTTVFPLLTSVLADESEWESPHTFNPGHFLNEHGKFVSRNAFIPFSAGRRVCVGESLAKMEIFLFFTSLLQHFRFTPAPGVTEQELDLTPVVGFTLTPPPHNLCAVERS